MSKRILIVEDELPIAELEKDYLELSGFEVVICSDGTEGMKMATTEKFDMVILDLMLPGMDGFEICKKIRETSEIPVMMVSAKKEDIDKIRGLGLGANDYMTKPFSPSELVARVKAHLERYKKLVGSAMKEENEVIEAGDELVVENALFGLRLLDCSRLLGCGFARLCRALLRGGSLCHVNPLF